MSSRGNSDRACRSSTVSTCWVGGTSSPASLGRLRAAGACRARGRPGSPVGPRCRRSEVASAARPHSHTAPSSSGMSACRRPTRGAQRAPAPGARRPPPGGGDLDDLTSRHRRSAGASHDGRIRPPPHAGLEQAPRGLGRGQGVGKADEHMRVHGDGRRGRLGRRGRASPPSLDRHLERRRRRPRAAGRREGAPGGRPVRSGGCCCAPAASRRRQPLHRRW